MDVVIYTRVSTDDQKENGFSLQDQERRLRHHCKENGKNILNHYQDDYSAKDFNRPAFNKFLQAVRKKEIRPRQFICVKQDRFSRNMVETFKMTQTLKSFGIDILFLENHVDLSQPESVLLYAINVAIPEVENRRRALNTKQGMRQAMRLGRWPWKAPKGYVNDKTSRTVVVSDDSKYVVRAYEQVALNVRSIDSIRIELNSMGFAVSKQQFLNLLKNPFYKGLIQINAWENEKEEIVRGIHEPLIGEELFDKVQVAISARSKKQSKRATYTPLFPLRGHLNCKMCGNKLTASSSMGRSRKYPYYHCQNGCKERFDAESANKLFIEYISTFTVNSEVSELYLEILKDEFDKNEGSKQEQLNQIKSQMGVCEEQIRNADAKLLSGTLPDEHYLRIVNGVNEHKSQLEHQLKVISETPTRYDKHLKFGINLMTHLPYYYTYAPIELKHKIVGSIFYGNLVFDGDSYRTNKSNAFVELICSDSTIYQSSKKEKTSFSRGLSNWAPPSVQISNQLKEDLIRLIDLQHFIDVELKPAPENNYKIFNQFIANVY
jgi:DNA invertase Pin-like site-specific DNA recombinase/transcription elongation factor Elf1